MSSDAMLSALILFGAGIAGVGIARAARLSPLIGFFITGAAIGPHALGLIPENSTVHVLAEIGVAFFLFEVGLHLPLRSFVTSWRELFILGPLQVLFCSLGVALCSRWLGTSWPSALLIGATLSLSSTAVVLRLLQDHNEMSTPVGQRIASILIFQDLVAVVLLALIGAFEEGHAGAGQILVTVATMAGGLVFVVAVGRWLLQPFLAWVIRLEAGEVVTGAALFAVLSLAWLGMQANLSIALGAFLAGVCLAESRYGYVVQTEIAPFRMLLLSLFFLTVGLSLDPAYVLRNLPTVLGVTIGIMAVKFLLTTGSQMITGIGVSPAIRAGALVAQGSEFAFIVSAAGLAAGLLSTQAVSIMTTATTLSLALTPLAGLLGCMASRKLARNLEESEPMDPEAKEVLIVEFDEVAWGLATILQRARIRYRGHDRDWPRILLARSRGFDVHFSDPDRPRTLSRAASGLTRAIVILVEDSEVIDRLMNGLQALHPDFPILAATRNLTIFEKLSNHELTAVFIKNEETARLLATTLLETLAVDRQAIDQALGQPAAGQSFRAA